VKQLARKECRERRGVGQSETKQNYHHNGHELRAETDIASDICGGGCHRPI
jgi:hypothetical protein